MHCREDSAEQAVYSVIGQAAACHVIAPVDELGSNPVIGQ
jgi:hypothetical protein